LKGHFRTLKTPLTLGGLPDTSQIDYPIFFSWRQLLIFANCFLCKIKVDLRSPLFPDYA
jgi:hypothetical protein